MRFLKTANISRYLHHIEQIVSYIHAYHYCSKESLKSLRNNPQKSSLEIFNKLGELEKKKKKKTR